MENHLSTDVTLLNRQEPPQPASRAAPIGLGLTLVTSVGLCALTFPFLRRFSGAPYLASSSLARNAISRHITKLRRDNSDVLNLIDLGSGSGELVLDAARNGCNAHGVELNPYLVALSQWRAWRNAFPNASFSRHCLWDTPLHNYDIILVFGIPDIMKRLASKLDNDCKPGAWLISNTFPLPHAPHRRLIRTESGVHFYLLKPRDDLFTA